MLLRCSRLTTGYSQIATNVRTVEATEVACAKSPRPEWNMRIETNPPTNSKGLVDSLARRSVFAKRLLELLHVAIEVFVNLLGGEDGSKALGEFRWVGQNIDAVGDASLRPNGFLASF